MYSLFSRLFSLLLILFYYSIKTKSKTFIWGFGYLIFLLISGILFHILFPYIHFGSPTPQYAVFLVIVGIPFLVVFIVIAMEAGKEKVDKNKSWNVLFTPAKDNLIFWIVIILINLIAFVLSKGK